MTLEELKKSGNIIFEAISGSKAYGLDTPTSDTDIRGVFILPKEQFYGFNNIDQINDEKNDIVYYELKKFLSLLAKNNPNMVELLHMPKDCILYKHPLFDSIKQEYFLSKLCKNTFANYAYTQIKKARGLNKKIVNPMEKARKSVLDFCYIRTTKDSIPLTSFLAEKKLEETHCGLAKITHLKDCFNLFYGENLNYKGIAKQDANEVRLSSIPKEETPIALLYFNKDGYSTYCKRYKEYWDWVERRNDVRYQNNIAHGKNYDTKNMMHTFRLLQMAHELANGKLIVRRPNREELFSIKHGDYDYDELLKKADILKSELEGRYENSSLQNEPDLDLINNLLVEIRTKFYNLQA